jgi:hypothetical protein
MLDALQVYGVGEISRYRFHCAARVAGKPLRQ